MIPNSRITTKSFPAVTYCIGRLRIRPEDIVIEYAPDGAVLFRLPVACAHALEDFFSLRQEMSRKTEAARALHQGERA